MKSHDEPIPRNKKGRSHNKKLNSDQAYADTSEDGRNCGLERLNLGEPAQDSENESECLLAKSKESQRAKNRNTTRRPNILGKTSLHSGIGLRRTVLQGDMQHV